MSKPADIVEFTYMGEEPWAVPQVRLRPGHWTMRVIENKRQPVFKCFMCGHEMVTPDGSTFASDGLVGSPGGRGFRCGQARAGCPMVGRVLLVDYHKHAKLCQ